jgi:cyanophycinase-like exopeptidase
MPDRNTYAFLGLLFFNLLCTSVRAQNFTSYRTGSTTDLMTSPTGGTCLMGGRTEDDNAMRWFLERANGGDVLVLRASGSDGYNDYLFRELGLTLNSVETIVFNDATASAEAYVQNAIRNAEAIWLAGGDQSRYVDYWRGTAIDSLIRAAVTNRKVVIGGTSAGMTVLGGLYFSAANGTVSSDEALADPLGDKTRIDSARFLGAPYLNRVITDTHYSERDRQGRHLAFLARAQHDFSGEVYGIACDEYTAVCIDTAGVARVYGTAGEEDHAYFLQVNCDSTHNQPETITFGEPLTWDQGGLAIKVYRIAGTATGTRSFDLTDWQTGNGGEWWDWSATNGTFTATTGEFPTCLIFGTTDFTDDPAVVVSPNPVTEVLSVSSPWRVRSVRIVDRAGREVRAPQAVAVSSFTLSVAELSAGGYYLLLRGDRRYVRRAFIVP